MKYNYQPGPQKIIYNKYWLCVPIPFHPVDQRGVCLTEQGCGYSLQNVFFLLPVMSSFCTVQWKDLCVGDVVRIHKDQPVPVSILPKPRTFSLTKHCNWVISTQ